MSTNHRVQRSPAPWKEPTGRRCPHGRELVLVDGTWVRDHLDSDFSQGGNGYRYRFVPRGEIWIDVEINQVEWPFIALHECEESELMARGHTYSRAHDAAKKIEDRARARFGGRMPKQKRKYPKLTSREKELAQEYIPEEMRTKKYKREAAVAIGLSRARRMAAREELDVVVRKYLNKKDRK